MSHWRIRSRYGFGAGRVALCPQMHRHPRYPDPFLIGLRRLGGELWNEGDSPGRRVLAGTPALLMGLFTLCLLTLYVVRTPVDQSDIQIVMLRELMEPPPPIPVPVVEREPFVPAPRTVPEAAVAQVEPPPVVEERQAPAPRPAPEVVPAPPPQLARVEPEPPRPKVRPRPEPPVARPVPVAVAPAPVAPEIDESRTRPRTQPVLDTRAAAERKPDIRIDRVARVEPARTPPPPARARNVVEAPAPRRPREQVEMATPAVSVPSEARTPDNARRAVVGAPRSQARSRPSPNVDAVAAQDPLPTADAPPVARRRAAFVPATTESTRARPAPSVEPAVVASADVPDDAPRQVRRSARPDAARATPRASRAAVPTPALAAVADDLPETRTGSARRARTRPSPAADGGSTDRSLEAASLAAPAVAGSVAPADAASGARRTARAQPIPQASDSNRSGADSSLSGVPLGSLAACMSDRDEDSLKQQVVAAVTTQRECNSPAGIYRFVETKNLNAFLMWIDRAPGRAVADRCGELRLALECLERGAAR